jgi:hypothetical protein
MIGGRSGSRGSYQPVGGYSCGRESSRNRISITPGSSCSGADTNTTISSCPGICWRWSRPNANMRAGHFDMASLENGQAHEAFAAVSPPLPPTTYPEFPARRIPPGRSIARPPITLPAATPTREIRSTSQTETSAPTSWERRVLHCSSSIPIPSPHPPLPTATPIAKAAADH